MFGLDSGTCGATALGRCGAGEGGEGGGELGWEGEGMGKSGIGKRHACLDSRILPVFFEYSNWNQNENLNQN